MLELLTKAQNFFLQPVSRIQYVVSVPGADSALMQTSQNLPDDAVSFDDQVSYCATNNSVVPPASPPGTRDPNAPRSPQSSFKKDDI
jgi:hypothetical protein